MDTIKINADEFNDIDRALSFAVSCHGECGNFDRAQEFAKLRSDLVERWRDEVIFAVKPERSEERTQFLTDILITAVEGGIGYWSLCTDYVWAAEDPAERRATIIDQEAIESGEDDAEVAGNTYTITLDMLDEALAKISDPSAKIALHEDNRKLVAGVNAFNDAGGEVDAGVADWIFQVAALGDVIYG